MIAFRNELWFCSNFYPCEIEYEGIVYPSSEHAYQAAKTLDKDLRLLIKDLEKPGQTKKLGKKIVLRENWDTIKVDIMKDILNIKFKNPELLQKLKATGTKTLTEQNEWHDNFWGVCTCLKCPKMGRNMLGLLLMDIRDKI